MNSDSSLTFRDWLSRHKRRDSPLGDLANDVQHDRCFPDAGDLQTFILHVMRHGGCFDAIRTVRYAWSLYQRSLRNSETTKPRHSRVGPS